MWSAMGSSKPVRCGRIRSVEHIGLPYNPINRDYNTRTYTYIVLNFHCHQKLVLDSNMHTEFSLLSKFRYWALNWTQICTHTIEYWIFIAICYPNPSIGRIHTITLMLWPLLIIYFNILFNIFILSHGPKDEWSPNHQLLLYSNLQGKAAIQEAGTQGSRNNMVSNSKY